MTKIMVVIGFLVAFAAGLTVGLEMRRPGVVEVVEAAPAVVPATTQSTTGPTTRQGRSGWIVSQLKLTREQQKEMDRIWSAVARGGRDEMEKRRHQLRKDRDEAILALVKPEDKPKYDAILQKYEEDQRAAQREMRQRFENAVEETNKLLTDEQRAKYKAMLNRHRPPDRDRDDDRRRDRDRNDRDRDRDDDENKKPHAKRNDDNRKADSCEQARGSRDARDAETCAQL